MSPGPTFDRVYLALKERLTGGCFAPGDHLEPAVLGEELASSITPVRDALHRLVGERIVEAPRNDGFRVPAPTEAELRDLYGWNRELIDIALRRGGSAGVRSPNLDFSGGAGVAGEAGLAAAHLFLRIARRSGNPEHEAAVANLNDRLASFRLVEQRLFQEIGEEMAALENAFKAGETGALRRGLAAYHRRRQRCAPDLLVIARRRRDP